MKTYKIHISGTVQGVLFRQFLSDKAKELDVKGYARNLDNGKVEAVIEGKDDNAKMMLMNCRKGPDHAEVKDTEVEEIKHQGFKEFKILRF